MYYYPGHRIQNQFCTQSALSPLPEEHSGQSPFYRRTQCQLNHNIVCILPGPHLAPGSRAAMWIKCLAEGQKYRATVGFEPGLSTWESSGHTTIPQHLHFRIIQTYLQLCIFLLLTQDSFLADRSLCTYLLAARYAMPSAISAAMLMSSSRVGAGFLSANYRW